VISFQRRTPIFAVVFGFRNKIAISRHPASPTKRLRCWAIDVEARGLLMKSALHRVLLGATGSFV